MEMLGEEHAISYVGPVMADNSETNDMGGTPRATKRPAHLQPPAHWTNSPLPSPAPIRVDKAEDQPGGRDPVRYGDWELKGLAIDF